MSNFREHVKEVSEGFKEALLFGEQWYFSKSDLKENGLDWQDVKDDIGQDNEDGTFIVPMDILGKTIYDFDKHTERRIEALCYLFLRKAQPLLDKIENLDSYYNGFSVLEAIGGDLYYELAGHGVGFYARDKEQYSGQQDDLSDIVTSLNGGVNETFLKEGDVFSSFHVRTAK